MSPRQVLRKVQRGLDSIGFKLSKGKREAKIKDLRTLIAKGKLAEATLQSESWREFVEPWLQNERKSNVDDLVNRRRHYADDIALDYQRGKVHMITQLKAMLNAFVVQKPEAEAELTALTRQKEEESNVRRTT